MAQQDYASNTINLDTTNFAGSLSTADTDVQKAFDTLDDMDFDATYLRLDCANSPLTGDLGLTGSLLVTSDAAANIPFTIKGAASQSGDVIEVYDSSNNLLLSYNYSAQNLITLSNPGIGNYNSIFKASGVAGGPGDNYAVLQLNDATNSRIWAFKHLNNNNQFSFAYYTGAAWTYPCAFEANGDFNIGTGATGTTPNDLGAQFGIQNDTAGDIALIVKGAASQSANLTAWQDSSSTVLSFVDASGRLRIGAPSALLTTKVEVHSDSAPLGYGDGIVVYEHSNTAGTRPVVGFYRSRGTFASQSNTAASDVLGSFSFFGYNSGYKVGPTLRAVQAAAGSTNIPSNLEVWTSNGSTENLNFTVGYNGGFKFGSGQAGIDLVITFDGETTDGVLTWMEDEDYFKFSDDIMLVGGENIILDTSTGTKIGTATNQLLGFYNATPVDQPATVSDSTTQDLTGTDTIDQAKLESDLSGIVTAVNTIIDRLQELGLIA